MPREIEVLTVLNTIERLATETLKLVTPDESGLRSRLNDITEYAKRGATAMNDTSNGALLPAVAMTSPASVQIEQAAKGPPRATVKVYAHDPHIASQTATTLYDELVAKYAEAAKVQEGAAS